MSRAYHSWLACLIVLSTIAAALLPPIAHAYLHNHGKEAGHTYQATDAQSLASLLIEAIPEESQQHPDPCPFCMQHATAAFPVVSKRNNDLVDEHMIFVPPLYLSASCTLFAWLIPSSRAPPFHLS